jgi:hypothetical protein
MGCVLGFMVRESGGRSESRPVHGHNRVQSVPAVAAARDRSGAAAMAPAVAELTLEEMLAVSAYSASLQP